MQQVICDEENSKQVKRNKINFIYSNHNLHNLVNKYKFKIS